MMKLSRLIAQFLAVLVTMLVLLNLPYLFTKEGAISFAPQQFADALVSTFHEVIHTKTLTFYGDTLGPALKPKEYPLFPQVLEPYAYSMTLLSASFCIALLSAVTLTCIYLLSSSIVKKAVQGILFVLESLPDVLIAVGLQVFFIWSFQLTHVRIVHTISFNDDKTYALPIICLTVLPVIQLFRMLVLYLEDERRKPYVEIARGKGLSDFYILRVHLFRNILMNVLHHSKTVFVFMLSNLLVLEMIFNINGIMRFLITQSLQAPVTTVITLMLLLIPFFLFYSILSYTIKRMYRESGGAY